ncbi:hypothetical protein OBBRIDRAFT_787189 [Obba rivulosa]|uniref:Trypsin-like peptidase domain-containing protein n=1 Tax=Obba rivulosa TaxID=1052685 RepID=A0A8E2J7K7_9APHY|nr:hypothetical protein OBBRIDRAFT_787189 [Obba rivulosa]
MLLFSRHLCAISSGIQPLYRHVSHTRKYAIVGPTTIVGQPPTPPTPSSPPPEGASPELTPLSSAFDAEVLLQLRKRATTHASSPNAPDAHVPLPNLIEQYLDRNGRVLNIQLPYESRPGPGRRIEFHTEQGAGDDGGAAMIVHAALREPAHKVAHSSGFALNTPEGQPVIVTCAHTLEEIRHHPILRSEDSGATPESPSQVHRPLVSGSFIITGPPSAPIFTPVASILSALNRADVLLLSPNSASPIPGLRHLPLSPYPAHPGTRIRAHFVADSPPADDPEGWCPWIGGTFAKWVRGTIVGYHDFAGREAKPGTYDALSHLLFEPPPTSGSSGGPIVDEDSGAVVGVMLGTQMRNRLEGVCGWGAPSETIYEMFSLPGLKLNSS